MAEKYFLLSQGYGRVIMTHQQEPPSVPDAAGGDVLNDQVDESRTSAVPRLRF